MPRRYEDALAGLEERGRLRSLARAEGHDFTSNDYLGLAEFARAESGGARGARTRRRGGRGRLAASARQ